MKLQDGFLDCKLNESILAFREEHKSEYLVIFKTKTFLDEIQNCFIGKTVSKQDAFLAASILELNNLFQSAILLFERGLPESANIIVRSILELSFKVIELIRNDDFLQEMILDVEVQAIKMLKDVRNHKLYDLISQNKIDEWLNRLQLNIPKNSKADIGVCNLADHNKMKKEYILYRMYCDYTHLSAKIIDQIIKPNGDGVILNGDLRLDGFSKSMSLLLSVTMISFPKIVQHPLIDEKLKNQLDDLQEDFVKAFKQQ